MEEDKIMIDVICSNGRMFSIESWVEAKVVGFKDLLAYITHVSAYHQKLIYKEKILDDDRTLGSYGLQAHHAIHLEVIRPFRTETTPPSNTTTGKSMEEEEEMIMIEIVCENGDIFSVASSVRSKVVDFKNLLARNISLPAKNQRLSYKGIVLEDGQTLCSYGLQVDHAIHLEVVRTTTPTARERDSSHQEALLWHSELAKARERVVILEGAVVRADEKVRVKEAEAEAAIKEATEKETAARKENQELLAYINVLQLQLQRQEENTKHVLEERGESCSEVDTQPLTKHVHPSEENVDKACLSVSRNIQVSERSLVHPPPSVDQTRPINDGEWNDIEATEARISDVREIAPDTEGNSLDIPVFVQPNDGQGQEGNAYHPDVHTFGPPDDTQTEQSMDSYHQP